MIPKVGHWYFREQSNTLYYIDALLKDRCHVKIWDRYVKGGLGTLHSVGYDDITEIAKEVADIMLSV